jgi:hypothetical protein
METQNMVSKAVARMEMAQKPRDKPKEHSNFYCSNCRKRGNHRTEKCPNRTPKAPALNVVRKGAQVTAASGGGGNDGDSGGTRPCPLCQNKHFYFIKFLNKRLQGHRVGS